MMKKLLILVVFFFTAVSFANEKPERITSILAMPMDCVELAFNAQTEFEGMGISTGAANWLANALYEDCIEQQL